MSNKFFIFYLLSLFGSDLEWTPAQTEADMDHLQEKLADKNTEKALVSNVTAFFYTSKSSVLCTL